MWLAQVSAYHIMVLDVKVYSIFRPNYKGCKKSKHRNFLSLDICLSFTFVQDFICELKQRRSNLEGGECNVLVV